MNARHAEKMAFILILEVIILFRGVFSSEDLPIVLSARGSDRNNEGFLKTGTCLTFDFLTPRGRHASQSGLL
jgi:hypothetical protein